MSKSREHKVLAIHYRQVEIDRELAELDAKMARAVNGSDAARIGAEIEKLESEQDSMRDELESLGHYDSSYVSRCIDLGIR